MPRKKTTIPVFFPVFDPYVETWLDMRFQGHPFEHEDRQFVLFPINVLGRVLCRSWQTIALWEDSGWIPRPIFTVVGMRASRWYSEKQIRMMHEHQIHYIGDNPHRQNNQHVDRGPFFAAVRADWEIDFR